MTTIALLMLASVGEVSATAPAAEDVQFYMRPTEREVLRETNRQRRRFGLRPLRVDLRLLGSARRHARWMTAHRTLQHTSAPVAENIAMGQRDSGQALEAWMNSDGHRANILSASYTRIGVAAYKTPEGTIYWCQQFLR